MKRSKIPKQIETEILFLNRHTCCICHESGRDVQIHHIDGNHSHNVKSNLCVVCLDCHSKITGKRGLGKSYSQLEVKQYKKEWEKIVTRKYGFLSGTRPRSIPKIEKQLFVFEIKNIIYQMLGENDNNIKAFEKGFETLYHMAILEDLQQDIIEHLYYAFIISAMYDVNKPIAMIKALPTFFLYLTGPKDMKLTKNDERRILEAIEVIEYTHNISTETNKNYRILSEIKSSLSDFLQTALLYKNAEIFRKAYAVLKELRETATAKDEKTKQTMPKLTKEIDVLITDLRKEISKKKLKWKL